MEVVDNQATETQDNQQAPADSVDSTQQLDSASVQDKIETQQTSYKPFEKGKEKFKIDGKEEELDWETTKKYASLGKTAYQRMQEAAEIKTKSQESYRQLLELAKSDPQGLLRALNPNYNPQVANANQEQVTDDVDPQFQELKSVRDELNSLKSMIEKQEIDQERKLIESELTESSEKYDVLKGNRFAKEYIKQEYRKALQKGMNVSIDDVAFYVAQEMKEMGNKKTLEVKQRLEQKRKQAPVNAVSAGADSSTKKSMSLDDVKRLAGLI